MHILYLGGGGHCLGVPKISVTHFQFSINLIENVLFEFEKSQANAIT